MRRLVTIGVVTIAICLFPVAVLFGGPMGGITGAIYLAVVAPPLLIFFIWRLFKGQKKIDQSNIAARMGSFIALTGLSMLLFLALVLGYIIVTSL